MTKQEMIDNTVALFPMEIVLTEELIRKGQSYKGNIERCVGAQTLRHIISITPFLSQNTKFNDPVCWGCSDGALFMVYEGEDKEEERVVPIDVFAWSEDKLINMMDVTNVMTIKLTAMYVDRS